jgi:hypothetical protein
MENIIDIKPTTIIGDMKECYLTLDSWREFQSRQGNYGSMDKEGKSNGTVKAFINGTPVDYVKIYSEAQANSIKFLIDHQDKVRDNLLLGLLANFPNMKEIYEDYIPDILSIEQYKPLIGLSTVHVMSSEKDDYAYIGFELGCTWDEEHGVGVMMHKDRVVSVGQADESFNTWTTYKDNGTEEQQTKRWNEQHAHLKGDSKTKPWWKFWSNN